MPGKHTAKEKRQAKHIVAGYKKRGASDDRAKSIAWATVNKQKNESSAWLFAGPGSPVYLGNPDPVSQFNPSGQVSPGAGYIPDEVAKMLVKESGLRKSDTIPKRVIESYLESMRLSKGLAVDVARVLRDVYGITPTFDESSLYAVSGSLVEELTGVMNESFPMPFAFNDEPQLLNEVDIVGSFIQSEFMESKDESYDLVLGHLALLPFEEFCDVVDFHEWVGTDVFNYIEELAVNGPDGFAEMVVEGLCFPFRVAMMPEHVQGIFENDIWPLTEAFGRADIASKATATMHGITPEKHAAFKTKTAPSPEHKAFGAKVKADWAKSDQQAKQQAGKAAKAARGAERKAAAEKEAVPPAKVRMRMQNRWQDKTAPEKQTPHQKLAALRKARGDSEGPKADPSPSHMKKAGGTTVGVMRKVGRAGVSAAAHVAHAAGDVVGSAASGVRKGWNRFNKDVDAKVANIHAHGSVKDPEPGSEGAARKERHAKAASSGERKPGLLRRGFGHIAKAVGKFARHVKDRAVKASPGIAHVAGGGDSDDAPAVHKDAPKKGPFEKKRMEKSQVGQTADAHESTYASGALINEVEAMLGGQPIEGEDEPEENEVRSPAEVVSTLEAATVVDQAVCEALAEMDWDGVAKMAGFMMLVPQRFLGLVQSFKESMDDFRAEWGELEESGTKPSWMNIGSFVTLSKLSLDEGVVPRIVYWAGKALQAADEAVVAHVNESYPELGQTVYGPAGNPKEGPELAKAYLTPQPAGTMTPTKSDCTTRMFSDPEDRAKARKAKLADVMAVLDGMRSAAAAHGVPPEGMFLNLYRDMHREKIRYS